MVVAANRSSHKSPPSKSCCHSRGTGSRKTGPGATGAEGRTPLLPVRAGVEPRARRSPGLGLRPPGPRPSRPPEATRRALCRRGGALLKGRLEAGRGIPRLIHPSRAAIVGCAPKPARDNPLRPRNALNGAIGLNYAPLDTASLPKTATQSCRGFHTSSSGDGSTAQSGAAVSNNRSRFIRARIWVSNYKRPFRVRANRVPANRAPRPVIHRGCFLGQTKQTRSFIFSGVATQAAWQRPLAGGCVLL